MAHPRCVGWGEIGLDYHHDNSPRKTQQTILIRQLRQAVQLGKPVTIHTREAEEDTERILKTELPKDHKVLLILCPISVRKHVVILQIHVHCYTDSPALAQRLLEHFTNLHIGITGACHLWPDRNNDWSPTHRRHYICDECEYGFSRETTLCTVPISTHHPRDRRALYGPFESIRIATWVQGSTSAMSHGNDTMDCRNCRGSGGRGVECR